MTKLTDKLLQALVNQASPAWCKRLPTEDQASIVCNGANERLRSMAPGLAAEVLRLRKVERAAIGLLSTRGYDDVRRWHRLEVACGLGKAKRAKGKVA